MLKVVTLTRKVVTLTRLHHQANLSSFNSHSHRTIFHTRAHHASQSHLGHNHISPIHYSWRSNHTLSTIVRFYLSQPMIVRHFALNSRNALLNRFPRLLRLHFRRQNFNINGNHGSNFSSWKSWFYRLSPNDMVLGLIIANVAVFLLWRIADKKFMINNFTISLDNIKSGRLHTLITNAFSHVDTWHIISNMLGLYFFGGNLIGSRFGTQFLLKLYLAGAVGGSIFYLVHQAYKAQTEKGQATFSSLGLGASGAVNAIMLLDIFLFPKATLYLDFFIPVPAVLVGIFLIGKDILRIMEGDSRISGSGHLGGAAVAAIAWTKLQKGRF